MQRLLILCIFLTSGTITCAQEYGYTRYTIANGLPSNTVYDITQDLDGFIWIATDAGLVRFDGRNMVTYTMNDGLPANDNLKLYSDSKGRTWIAAIHRSLCYHYKGKIYSFKNDSFLNKIKLSVIPMVTKENDQQDLMFCGENGSNNVYILTSDNKFLSFKLPHQPLHSLTPFKGPGKAGFSICAHDSAARNILAFTYDGQWKHERSIIFSRNQDTIKHFESLNGTLQLVRTEQSSPNHLVFQYNPLTGKGIWNERPPIPDRISGTGIDGWKTWYYGTINGTYLTDSSGKISEHLLPGVVTNRAFTDRENNIWIGTNAEGLVLIPSKHVKNLAMNRKETFLFTLHKSGDTILAGSTYGNLMQVVKGKTEVINFDKYIRQSNNKTQDNRLRVIKAINNKEVILCYDNFLLKYNPSTRKEVFSRVDVSKELFILNEDSICAFTGRAALLLDSRSLTVLDTILPIRSYSGLKTGSAWYIGTANGPVKVLAGKELVYLGNNNAELNTLISHMQLDKDGSIWMSTLGNGIFRIRNDQVVAHYNTGNGLNSNNCKAIALDDRFLWVGTEKGLNRIDRQDPLAAIQQYSTEDGLSSNNIFSILSDNGKIYVGTEGFLSWFDSSKIKETSICQLQLLSIEQGKHAVQADSLLQLKYDQNNLKFSFTALSFRSSNNILYLYRLKGLSDTWDSTRNTNLEFLALPPGEYELEIFARNKFGLNSNTILVPFNIKPPFWATWWFRLLIIGIIIAIAWWVILRRVRQEQEKSATQNRINELEQQALRSQMNPHFIFNCLNSIQNFLLQNNFEKTNEYLTAFAHLIRQTLDNSSRPTISIEGEMKYLSSYLELESMRFGHSFEYSIEADPDIDISNIDIPTMILQPYVENSIRHGIRYSQETGKAVKVNFLKRGNTLVCIVEDNGVGRKRASELKSFMHVEYQSKGMRLTGARLEALNRLQDLPITIDVIDMEEAGNATGTQVIVRFPNMFL